jgi:hypothetical protein
MRKLILLVALTACATPTGPDGYPPFDSSDRTPVPTSEWVPVWESVLACADAGRPIPPLGVFTVPPANDEPLAGFNCGHPFLCWGLYKGGSVYVVDHLTGADRENVMAHEMLHRVLDGDADHCSPLWDSCGIANGTSCGSVSRGDHDPN